MLLIGIRLFFSVTFQNVRTIDIRLHHDTAEDMPCFPGVSPGWRIVLGSYPCMVSLRHFFQRG